MTRRELDWRSVRAKIRGIRQLLDDLESMGSFDQERLRSDRIPTLAAERVLTLIVDMAFSANAHVTKAGLIDRDLARAMVPAAGTRNALVHAYLDIDYGKIEIALARAPELFGDYVGQVARWIRQRAEEEQDGR
ncbi:MAG: DUF86 domain-containing protein [Pseudonocardia sp.]|nr:DUF86 domain-containing protein [Pseudonocardia sp.]